MKKTITMVFVLICVLFGVCSSVSLYGEKQQHKIEIENLKSEYENRVENIKAQYEQDYSELKNQMTELENQVYIYMETDEAYEIWVDHENETHVWSGTKRGLFGDESHMIMY